MERLISNRLYFDYNATAPLTESVKDFLSKGVFSFGNPSSIHTEGRNARKLIRETFDFLQNLFQLKDTEQDIFFHSGATEGINSLVKGMAMFASSQGKKFHFFYTTVDHSSVVKQAQHLPLLGHHAHAISVNKQGQFDIETVMAKIKKVDGFKLFNFTHVNNETGIVWPLDIAVKIKSETGCTVHVDAVQTPGKILNWEKLDLELDAYTFSAHKFGALKGVGFTVLKNSFPWIPLQAGGGQQKGLRSGTENTLGIYTIKLALEDLIKTFNPKNLSERKNLIEKYLEELLQDKILVVGKNSPMRNFNTINAIFLNGHKAEVLIAKLDMEGMAVSSGSACSSGAAIASRVLLEMGIAENFAKASLRFSVGPTISINEVEAAKKILKKALIF